VQSRAYSGLRSLIVGSAEPFGDGASIHFRGIGRGENWECIPHYGKEEGNLSTNRVVRTSSLLLRGRTDDEGSCRSGTEPGDEGSPARAGVAMIRRGEDPVSRAVTERTAGLRRSHRDREMPKSAMCKTTCRAKEIVGVLVIQQCLFALVCFGGRSGFSCPGTDFPALQAAHRGGDPQPWLSRTREGRPQFTAANAHSTNVGGVG
jgi:hypothetical protein